MLRESKTFRLWYSFCLITFLPFFLTAAAGEGLSGIENSIQTITIEGVIYFSDREGNPVMIKTGTYFVQPVDQAHLRLLPQAEQPSIDIRAETSTHDEKVSAPTALLVTEDGQDNDVHLLLTLPEGQVFDALGSISGTRPRATGFRPLNGAQVQSAIIQQRPIGKAAIPSPVFTVPSAVTIPDRPAGSSENQKT